MEMILGDFRLLNKVIYARVLSWLMPSLMKYLCPFHNLMRMIAEVLFVVLTFELKSIKSLNL